VLSIYLLAVAVLAVATSTLVLDQQAAAVVADLSQVQALSARPPTQSRLVLVVSVVAAVLATWAHNHRLSTAQQVVVVVVPVAISDPPQMVVRVVVLVLLAEWVMALVAKEIMAAHEIPTAVVAAVVLVRLVAMLQVLQVLAMVATARQMLTMVSAQLTLVAVGAAVQAQRQR
jgi:hypothetical protein